MGPPYPCHSLSCLCDLDQSTAWVQNSLAPNPAFPNATYPFRPLFWWASIALSLHTLLTCLLFIASYYTYLKRLLICPINSLSAGRIHVLEFSNFYFTVLCHFVCQGKIWNINWVTPPYSSAHTDFHVLYT